MNSLLRRSASLAAAAAPRRPLATAAILAADSIRRPLAGAGTAGTGGVFQGFGGGLAGVSRRDFHFSAGPIGFRASDAPQAAHAVDDFYDEESSPVSGKKKGDDGLEIAKLGIANQVEIKRQPKVTTTKICIVLRSFENPLFENVNLGTRDTRKVGLPKSRVLYTVLRSPHIDKKSREQFEMKIKKQFMVIKTEPHELRKKFFWLKRQRIFGSQYEIRLSCKTRLSSSGLSGGGFGSSSSGRSGGYGDSGSGRYGSSEGSFGGFGSGRSSGFGSSGRFGSSDSGSGSFGGFGKSRSYSSCPESSS